MILPLSVSSMMMALTDCRKSGCCSVVSCEFIVLSCEGFSPHPPLRGTLTEDGGDLWRMYVLMYMMSMIRTNVCVVKGEGDFGFLPSPNPLP